MPTLGHHRTQKPRPVPACLRYLPCVARACTVSGQIPGKGKHTPICPHIIRTCATVCKTTQNMFWARSGQPRRCPKRGRPGWVRNRASSPEPGIVAAYAIAFFTGRKNASLACVSCQGLCPHRSISTNSTVGSPACKGNLTASEGRGS